MVLKMMNHKKQHPKHQYSLKENSAFCLFPYRFLLDQRPSSKQIYFRPKKDPQLTPPTNLGWCFFSKMQEFDRILEVNGVRGNSVELAKALGILA